MFTALQHRSKSLRPAAGRQPGRTRGRPTVARPRLEPLEDRSLPSGYSLGRPALISNPDPLVNTPPVPNLVAVEPYVAVNPTNAQNIVAAWRDGDKGLADSASFDGGQTWHNVAIPGITLATGGTSQRGTNNWLSFAPNGDLYSIGLALGGGPWIILANKSTDGGLTWSNPIQLDTVGNPAHIDDKPSITADPTNPDYVYATWASLNPSFGAGNRMETMFARSTDGGTTWQPEQSIHQASSGDLNYGHQIVVLPDGTLIDAFTEGQFTKNHAATLTLLRSADRGQTWSAPIAAVVQQPLVDPNAKPANALVTDPDTGQGIETHPMFPSVAVDSNNGNLYAAWQDARFSNFQYNGIAFSMSSDGGLTWSTPSQVNQTPTTVPAADRQAWNPTVAVADDGTIAVSYYDFRNNTAAPGALTDYWLAYAPAPAGHAPTWSEMRLTDASFDLEQAPTRFNGGFFLGDYEGLAAAGNDFVAVWGMPDGSATAQESIFFRRAIAGAPAHAPAPRAAGVLAPQATAIPSQAGGGRLIVGSYGNNSVLRYDEGTGAFVDQFDPHNLGGLKNPVGGVVGPDGNLYVTSSIFEGNHPGVLRYDGTTGAFLGVFASQNLTSPRGVLFGPDGNLYVANGNEGADPASVERFDGRTGAFIDYFVRPDSGGLEHPSYMVFGPNGGNDGHLDLYVGAPHDGSVLRYDGTTGAFKDVFVSPGSGGLNSTQGMVFGPDGSLFVASGNWFAGSNGPFYPRDFPAGAILHFEGPSGAHPGALVGTGPFVAGGAGGLANPAGIVYGPDPSGNGQTDLYVASSLLHGPGNLDARNGTSEVLRYDAETGAFLGTFVTPDSGGLKFATFLTFTETDPATLNYNGGAHPFDAPALHGVRIADLGGTTPGTAWGQTFTPDAAAVRGRFGDRTSPNGPALTRSGNPGEWHRAVVPAVREDEIGHPGGVLAVTSAGVSRDVSRLAGVPVVDSVIPITGRRER